MNKKEILEMARQAGYDNDYQTLTRLFLEKSLIAGETNLQRAFIKGQKQREKQNNNEERTVKSKKFPWFRGF